MYEKKAIDRSKLLGFKLTQGDGARARAAIGPKVGAPGPKPA